MRTVAALNAAYSCSKNNHHYRSKMKKKCYNESKKNIIIIVMQENIYAHENSVNWHPLHKIPVCVTCIHLSFSF
jgi:hypothetical protein